MAKTTATQKAKIKAAKTSLGAIDGLPSPAPPGSHFIQLNVRFKRQTSGIWVWSAPKKPLAGSRSRRFDNRWARWNSHRARLPPTPVGLPPAGVFHRSRLVRRIRTIHGVGPFMRHPKAFEFYPIETNATKISQGFGRYERTTLRQSSSSAACALRRSTASLMS